MKPVTPQFSDRGPVCPYCLNHFTPDEAFYYDERRFRADECSECGRHFGVEVETTVTWRTYAPQHDDHLRVREDHIRAVKWMATRDELRQRMAS